MNYLPTYKKILFYKDLTEQIYNMYNYYNNI